MTQNIHFPINMGGVTFSVEMRSGEDAPLGPALCVEAQQNGQLLNRIQLFTDPASLYALADYLTLQAKKFSDMDANNELCYHPLRSTVVDPYKESGND